MIHAFKSYIGKQQLLCHGDKTLIAISGGLDSVVLTHLFYQAKLPFALAHVNFALRGIESDGDEEFVIQLAKKYGVECHVKKMNTEEFASHNKVSIQMAARELRYAWFQELAIKYDYKQIATAHHWDDSVETVLLNLAKGTGIRGLHGILPKKGNLIRPLLFASKDELESYADKQNLIWREDASNASDKYQRNYIRHNLIPQFQHLNPAWSESMKSSVAYFQAAETLMQATLDKLKSNILLRENDSIKINLPLLLKNPHPAFILHEWISELGFTESQCQNITETENLLTGSQFNSEYFTGLIDRDFLIISPKKIDGEIPFQDLVIILDADNGAIEIKDFGTLEWQLMDFERMPDFKNPNIAYFDADKIEEELTIRNWREGDHFQPLGMKGKKLLSDFMIDAKIPLNLKSSVLLLCSGEKIAWVISHRIDDKFKLTNSTKRILKLTYQPHD
ncbi:tRNA lysidine(34) synthetase TilS [Peijinzhouia sedimentorum]